MTLRRKRAEGGFRPYRVSRSPLSEFPISVRRRDLLGYLKNLREPSDSTVRSKNGLRERAMNELERSLNRVLQEHQQESGLHMIGGQRRLIDRLMHLFEEQQNLEKQSQADKNQEN